MKTYPKFAILMLLSIFICSCSGETKTHTVKTPKLALTASGPLFQGSNTATATWNYDLKELFPNVKEEVEIKSARVSSIQVMPIKEADYPQLGKMVVEMKSPNTKMTRIGLLDADLDVDQTNNLSIADVQEDLEETFTDEKIIFVGDIDMKDEQFYDDLRFDLVVTFDIETNM